MAQRADPGREAWNQFYLSQMNVFRSPEIDYLTWNVRLPRVDPALTSENRFRILNKFHQRLVERELGHTRSYRGRLQYVNLEGAANVTLETGFSVNKSRISTAKHGEILITFVTSTTINLATIMDSHRHLSYEYLSRMVKCYVEALCMTWYYVSFYKNFLNNREQCERENGYKKNLVLSREDYFQIVTLSDPVTVHAMFGKLSQFYACNLSPEALTNETKIAMEACLDTMFANPRTCPTVELLKESPRDVTHPITLNDFINDAMTANNIAERDRMGPLLQNFITRMVWLKSKLPACLVSNMQQHFFFVQAGPLNRSPTTTRRETSCSQLEAYPMDVFDPTYWLNMLGQQKNVSQQVLQTSLEADVTYLLQTMFPNMAVDLANQMTEELSGSLDQSLLNTMTNFVLRFKSRTSCLECLSKYKYNSNRYWRYSFVNQGNYFNASGFPLQDKHPRHELIQCNGSQYPIFALYYKASVNRFETEQVTGRIFDTSGNVLGPESQPLIEANLSQPINDIMYQATGKKRAITSKQIRNTEVLRNAIRASSGNIIYAGEGLDNSLDPFVHRSLVELADVEGVKFVTQKVKSYDGEMAKYMASSRHQWENPPVEEICREMVQGYMNPLVQIIKAFMACNNESPLPPVCNENELLQFSADSRQWVVQELHHFALELVNTLPLDEIQLHEKEFTRQVLQYRISFDYARFCQIRPENVQLVVAEKLEEAFAMTFNPPHLRIYCPITIWPNPFVPLRPNLQKYFFFERRFHNSIFEIAKDTAKEFLHKNRRTNRHSRSFEYLYEGNFKRSKEASHVEPSHQNHYIMTSFWNFWEELDHVFHDRVRKTKDELNAAIGVEVVTQAVIRLFSKILPGSHNMSHQAMRQSERLFCCSKKDPRGPFGPFLVKHHTSEMYLRHMVSTHTKGAVRCMPQRQRLSSYVRDLSKEDLGHIWHANCLDLIRIRGIDSPSYMRNFLEKRFQLRKLSLAVIPENEKFGLDYVCPDWPCHNWPVFINTLRTFAYSAKLGPRSINAVSRNAYWVVSLSTGRGLTEDGRIDEYEDRNFEDQADQNLERGPEEHSDETVETLTQKIVRICEGYRKDLWESVLCLGIAGEDGKTPIHLERTRKSSFPNNDFVERILAEDRFDIFPFHSEDTFAYLEELYLIQNQN